MAEPFIYYHDEPMDGAQAVAAIANRDREIAALRDALEFIRDTEWSSEQVNPLKYVARRALEGKEWKE